MADSGSLYVISMIPASQGVNYTICWDNRGPALLVFDHIDFIQKTETLSKYKDHRFMYALKWKAFLSFEQQMEM